MGCSIHEITGSISTIIMLAIVMPGAYLLILSRKIKKMLTPLDQTTR